MADLMKLMMNLVPQEKQKKAQKMMKDMFLDVPEYHKEYQLKYPAD